MSALTRRVEPGKKRAEPEKKTLKKRWWLALGSSTLWLSILAHVLFGAVAACIIVEHFSKKTINFVAAPPPAPPDVEHKVQLAKKNDVASAPPDLKRITTTDISPISMPDVPETPVTDDPTPTTMAGNGDTGEGLGSGLGVGAGTGGGSGSGNPFGSQQDPGIPEFVGNLYDLKQTPDRKPTGMTSPGYHHTIEDFVARDWDPSVLERYYKARKQLHTSAIFVPTLQSVIGPEAFGVESEVQPNMYAMWYKVTATPTEDGTYRFVGLADDILVVRANGHTVLDGSLTAVKSDLYGSEKRYPILPGFRTTYHTENAGLYVGDPIQVKAGDPVSIDVLIGEEPGGQSLYFLFIQRMETTYPIQSNGSPLLPVFQLDANKIHPESGSATYPPFLEDPAPWKAVTPDAGG